MKPKYPDSIWVGFDIDGFLKVIYHPKRFLCKRYRLSRGNDVLRVLNIMHKTNKGYLVGYYNGWLLALRQAGFKVRWDAKKGRFV